MNHPKNRICLMLGNEAEDAARFYATTFPDSSIGRVVRVPGDHPSGSAGEVLTVEFSVLGIPCIGVNGGDHFKQTEAFSFQVVVSDQAETDRYWDAIVGTGGSESMCGWCKDRWGVSWQITPKSLLDALDAGGLQAKQAFDAVMQMKKIDVSAVDAIRANFNHR